MQTKQSAYVGIDIGADLVKCVIGVEQMETHDIQILGLGTARNSGMRRGSVVDVGDVAEALSRAIDETERISGFAIDGATISLNGTHLKSRQSKGVIAVTGNDRQITQEDVARVEEAATVVQIPPNREILHVVPRIFRLDGQEDIKDPVGMRGVRLEVEALLITASTPLMRNMHHAVEQAGAAMNDQFAAPLAAAHAVLTKEHREVGAALVDIGHSTTGVTIFEEDEVLHLGVLPIGSAHITNDLAVGLKTDLKTAEAVKIEYARVSDDSSRRTITIEDQNGEPVKAEQSFINEIVTARVEEIFELVKQELAAVDRGSTLPGGIILTGGGALIEGIDERAKEVLSLPARIGKPTGFTGLTDDIEQPQMATVVGLMMLDRDGYHRVGQSNWRVPLAKTGGLLRTLFERLKP